ncbi:serine/threonine-protein kinase [Streptomyces aurantiacus]|uniref:serine/threonine-protein kinase n=1 Tax=Streptomyces aurantiacus TaxID=47760 RepID=UPI0033FBFC1F
MREHVISADGDHQAATYPQRGSGRLIAGRYLLLDVLGRGGMGTVWRADDQLLDRPVAVKELHILTQGDEEHRIRLGRAVREARAVARVPHPHVVGVHDLVESEDRLWIVMELVEGPSLAHHIAATGPLTSRHTAALGLQLLEALEAVHAAGTLHRDVKPANVLLRRDGDAVLTDFGIAALDDGEFLTTTGELIGSLEFMAPERVTGAEVGPASDLWSLGATLATVCGGQSPFRRPARLATLFAVAYEEPVLPERLGRLRPVVEALLRKSPGERPSAVGAHFALQRIAAGEEDIGPLSPPTVRGHRPSASAAVADAMTGDRASLTPAGEPMPTAQHTLLLKPPPREPRSRRPRRPKRLWWALAGTTVLAAGVGGALYFTGVLLKEAQETTTTSQVVVRSTTGWQQATGASVRRGDRITLRFSSGEWTVDRQNMPMTGPTGYDAVTDKSLDGAKNCKVKPAAPFGVLLARLVGERETPVHTVGRKLTFRATGDGPLQLGINDAEKCTKDNTGTLTVQVSVTHQP